MPSLICVPIMVDDAAAAIADAQQARLAGADLVEFRIDRVFHGEGDEDGARAIERLIAESPLPCIVTCRPPGEGGEYDGDDAARVALFERICAAAQATGRHPPRYIDVELATYTRSANLRQKIDLGVRHPNQVRDIDTSLILSVHDFAGRPPRLLDTIIRMRSQSAAAVHKIAWRARSLRDNIEAFELLSERDRPTIMLLMGEPGLMSRVLASKFGGFLTFASLRDTSATAPGQPTIRDLLSLYRFRTIGPASAVYGVIGWPVGHSLSPAVHNAGFDAVGHDGVYLPLPIPPEWEHFKATVLALLDFAPLTLRGASVTIPHKEHLVRLAREDRSRTWNVDPLVERCGAANTLVVDPGGAVRVLNTDAGAAVAAVTQALSSSDLDGRQISILGAGGVARSIAAGFAQAGATVTIFNRGRERAERLVEDLSTGSPFAGRLAVGDWSKRCAPCCEVLINCTPVGMTGGPDPHGLPVEDESLARCKPGALVVETVYAPARTPLLSAAADYGLRVVDGLSIFTAQAAEQFRAWTGRPAPVGLFDRVVRETLFPPET